MNADQERLLRDVAGEAEPSAVSIAARWALAEIDRLRERTAALDAAQAAGPKCPHGSRRDPAWTCHWCAIRYGVDQNERVGRLERALCLALCDCGPASDPDRAVHDMVACRYIEALDRATSPAPVPFPLAPRGK